MEFIFISPGKTKEQDIASICDHYVKQISNHANVEWMLVKEAMDDRARETTNILEQLEKIKQNSSTAPAVFFLDELGKEYESLEFANVLQKNWGNGRRPLVFLLGGAYGFDQATLSQHIKKYNAIKLALSRLTFTHELARLVILEQIYRALHIQRGTKYHH